MIRAVANHANFEKCVQVVVCLETLPCKSLLVVLVGSRSEEKSSLIVGFGHVVIAACIA